LIGGSRVLEPEGHRHVAVHPVWVMSTVLSLSSAFSFI
jgi:hypothetical protein